MPLNFKSISYMWLCRSHRKKHNIPKALIFLHAKVFAKISFGNLWKNLGRGRGDPYRPRKKLTQVQIPYTKKGLFLENTIKLHTVGNILNQSGAYGVSNWCSNFFFVCHSTLIFIRSENTVFLFLQVVYFPKMSIHTSLVLKIGFFISLSPLCLWLKKL